MESGTLTDFLIRFFDHSFTNAEGCVRGGHNKANSLQTGEIIHTAKFKHPIIMSLLEDLITTVSVCYDHEPSERQIARLESLRALYNNDDEMCDDNQAALYKQRQHAISSSDWMLEKFNAALSDCGSWPEADNSVANPLCYDAIPDPRWKSQAGTSEPKLPAKKRRAIEAGF
jgi:hypothetical protein